ncbi:MAG TPA: hypothetical protein PLZ57_07765 [Pseudobdellovibrionaceae bacterium]|nr:hypothetical protein [Pseudobdellovibrionaceae bacterium]
MSVPYNRLDDRQAEEKSASKFKGSAQDLSVSAQSESENSAIESHREHERVQTHFHGFSPSEANRFYVDSFVQRLAEEAPRDAVIRAEISLHDHVFRGMIHVRSHSGRFFATASSANFHDLGPLLLGRLRKQLDRLRSPRSRARQTSLRAGA